jgi:hypothetical protein
VKVWRSSNPRPLKTEEWYRGDLRNFEGVESVAWNRECSISKELNSEHGETGGRRFSNHEEVFERLVPKLLIDRI